MRGRRFYGVICALSDGREFYLALRSRLEIFRSGEPNVNIAEAKGTACWAIDESTLLDLRVANVNLIGVIDYDSNDIYLATRKDWDGAKFMDYTSRGGALQRYLPVSHFIVKQGKARV